MLALRSEVIVSIRIIDNEDISSLRTILNNNTFGHFMTGLIVLFSLVVKLGQSVDIWRDLTLAFTETNSIIVERVFIELFKLVWY